MQLEVVAATDATRVDFRPYVASIADDGRVAYAAALAGGGWGVWVDDVRVAGLDGASSHPDLNAGHDVVAYVDGVGVVLVRAWGERIVLAAASGPLGPTINEAGDVAFRAPTRAGADAVWVARAGTSARMLAAVGERFSAFEGLPVVDEAGAVVFRAERHDGGQGIYRAAPSLDGPLVALVETESRRLGRFPSVNPADGSVAFVREHGLYVASHGGIEHVTPAGAFEVFRGVLLGGRVFYATPRGGTLGIYVAGERLLGLGDGFAGSQVVDFALNPVSVNRHGQLALRVELASGRQLILRGT